MKKYVYLGFCALLLATTAISNFAVASADQIPLVNADFSKPAIISPARYIAPCQAPGWTYSGNLAGAGVQVFSGDKGLESEFFWNSPEGSITQIVDPAKYKVERAGELYTLTANVGGQGHGTIHEVSTILIDGKVVASVASDCVEPRGPTTASTVTYTSTTEDVGKSIGVQFSWPTPAPTMQAQVADVSLFAGDSRADVALPSFFSDHMVLQHGIALPIWGTADPGETVSVEFAGQTASTKADASGKWVARLKPVQSGGPFTLTVSGKNSLTINDVLVGDVWLCSGQSNMQYQLNYHPQYYAADIAASTDPELRCFTVRPDSSFDPKADVKGVWQAANPQSVLGFTAVGYFYARELRKALGIPIGIINSSYGGTQAESWMSMDALSQNADLKKLADDQLAKMHSKPADDKAFTANTAKWYSDHGVVDAGNSGLAAGWANPTFDDSGWITAQTNVRLNTLGLKGGGVVWYRRSFTTPPDFKPEDTGVNCGYSANVLNVYFNGTPLVNRDTTPQYYPHSQSFFLPAVLIKPGQSFTIAVRATVPTDNEGLFVNTNQMQLPVDHPEALDNNWKFKVEQTFPALTDADRAALPKAPDANMQNTATTLFNAMIHPLMPYGIKGTIWYQGESNQGRGAQYGTVLPLLIGDWRQKWGEGDFPFYIVQLANFGQAPKSPQVNSGWALVREGQLHAAETVRNSGIALAIDLGEANNIHPLKKQEVGRRLSLVALDQTYGKEQPYSGPIYTGMAVEGAQIRIHFVHVDGGLVAKGWPLTQFAIAGDDKQFVWADAKIDGDDVVVSAASVPHPTAVRYAWADNPEGCNLYNGAGLPASPFRTDSW